MSTLMMLGQMELSYGLGVWVELGFGLCTRVASVYLVVAIADYIYQRWQYTRGLKMTKEEIKEEYKQQEGDPMLKGRIRAQQRKMARMRMMSNVPKASVVITNPTHLAVAIQYDHDSMVAPKVVAKGAHLVAFRIADIARENGVPVVQNIPLARAVFQAVEIDQEIPPELYAAMAEILVYVYRLKGQKPVFAQ
jgi:flagellar biosynthetic protein FlhB